MYSWTSTRNGKMVQAVVRLNGTSNAWKRKWQLLWWARRRCIFHRPQYDPIDSIPGYSQFRMYPNHFASIYRRSVNPQLHVGFIGVVCCASSIQLLLWWYTYDLQPAHSYRIFPFSFWNNARVRPYALTHIYVIALVMRFCLRFYRPLFRCKIFVVSVVLRSFHR